EKKLRSPAQIEKVCKKKNKDFNKLKDLIHRPVRGTRMVTDAHPGQAIEAPTKMTLSDEIKRSLKL
ncbi:hypothetical protein M8745_18605, partial [Lutimaribacter sp. EGI FJ00014]|nr:hypothetical protein [Lutimaribacter sp. EGI FJ00014]